jgi:hypothetical protein
MRHLLPYYVPNIISLGLHVKHKKYHLYEMFFFYYESSREPGSLGTVREDCCNDVLIKCSFKSKMVFCHVAVMAAHTFAHRAIIARSRQKPQAKDEARVGGWVALLS